MLLLAIVAVITTVSLIAWDVEHLFKARRVTMVPNIYRDPYRTPAEVPAPAPVPKPIKQPKSKREWKMPNVKLGKVTKCFMWLLPVCCAAVVIGGLVDAPLLGQGLKVGLGIASGLVGLFCGVMVLVTADHKDY